jgi:hypothetical protein
MSITCDMRFSEAASSWLAMRDAGESRARYLKPRTIKTYRLELEALALFFKDTRLCDITNGHSKISAETLRWPSAIQASAPPGSRQRRDREVAADPDASEPLASASRPIRATRLPA